MRIFSNLHIPNQEVSSTLKRREIWMLEYEREETDNESNVLFKSNQWTEELDVQIVKPNKTYTLDMISTDPEGKQNKRNFPWEINNLDKTIGSLSTNILKPEVKCDHHQESNGNDFNC